MSTGSNLVCAICADGGSSYEQPAEEPIRLDFEGGNAYQVTPLILHYVKAHGYRPAARFITDVLEGRLLPDDRNRNVRRIVMGEFPNASFPYGATPAGFVTNLELLLTQVGALAEPVTA